MAKKVTRVKPKTFTDLYSEYAANPTNRKLLNAAGRQMRKEQAAYDNRAIYLHVRKAKVARTDELIPDTLFADYDKTGRLLGIEFLPPARTKADVLKASQKINRSY